MLNIQNYSKIGNFAVQSCIRFLAFIIKTTYEIKVQYLSQLKLYGYWQIIKYENKIFSCIHIETNMTGINGLRNHSSVYGLSGLPITGNS